MPPVPPCLGSAGLEVHREGIFPLRDTEIFPLNFKLRVPLRHFQLFVPRNQQKKESMLAGITDSGHKQEATQWGSGNIVTFLTLK